jgi:hypothetical protein
VASEMVIFEPDARVGLSVVLRDRGRSTISSWWGCSKDVGAKSPRTLGVGCRTPTSVLAAVVAAPSPPVVLPS